MATTSKKINLEQLDKELGGFGLIADFNNPKEKLISPAEESQISEDELEEAISNHIAVDWEAELAAKAAANAAEKAALLQRLGITADEAKLLLS